MSGDPFTPSCIQRWENTNIIQTKLEWEETFSKTNKITCNVRYQMFYYKVVHKNYASDAIVSKFDPSVNAKCIHCNIPCDIVHTFVSCIKIEPLWVMVQNWLKQNFQLKQDFVLTLKMKLLGISKKDCILNSVVIDFIILHVKLYIHKCRRSECLVSFISFLKYLKFEVLVERMSLKGNVQKLAALNDIENIL